MQASNLGDNETPATAGDLPLGGPATQISVGTQHSSAVLASGRLRCWGSNGIGLLGYGNLDNIGDIETPDTVGPVPVF